MSRIKLFGTNRARPRYLERSGDEVRTWNISSDEEEEEIVDEEEYDVRSPLKPIAIILAVLAVLEALYFICVYSNIPFIARYRTIYIQTAMSTMRHQWLATTFIPSSVINGVMDGVAEARAAQIGQESTWHTNDKPSAEPEDTPGTSEPEKPVKPAEPEEPKLSPEEQAEQDFYTLFWELDQDSMESYLAEHPEALDNGWDGIYINEAGLNDNGTSIRTTMDEQVLAIDVPNQILLVKVEGTDTGGRYIGVLAIAKDPSRLSVRNSESAWAGQYAQTIANNNNGVLAMTASGFIDDGGNGNGGSIAGYAMANGEPRGSHMGWGYKRIELRKNNYMYITDAQSSVHEDTTDAVEFMPALIVDGELINDEHVQYYSELNPRTVIGQSDLGEVLMLAIEGRQPTRSMGCGVKECAQILYKHNCMQAMNLDGGASTILWYDGEYLIRCSNGYPEGRQLPNAFIYERRGTD